LTPALLIVAFFIKATKTGYQLKSHDCDHDIN